MTICRTSHDKSNPYKKVSAQTFKFGLSAKATGILIYLLQQPDSWEPNVKQLKKVFRDGEASLQSGLDELKAAGYLVRRAQRDRKGRITGWETDIYEIPLPPEQLPHGDRYTVDCHGNYHHHANSQTLAIPELISPERDFPDMGSKVHSNKGFNHYESNHYEINNSPLTPQGAEREWKELKCEKIQLDNLTVTYTAQVIPESIAINKVFGSGKDSERENDSQPQVDPFSRIKANNPQARSQPRVYPGDPWTAEQLVDWHAQLMDFQQRRGGTQPHAFARKQVEDVRNLGISPFWNEFLAGLPMGSTQKPILDWLVDGKIYPAFLEDRVQYWVQKGEPIVAATERAYRDIGNTKIAEALWQGFLRRTDREAEENLAKQKLGVSTPVMSACFTPIAPITKESVAEKLGQVAEAAVAIAAAPSQQQIAPKKQIEIPSLEKLQRMWCAENAFERKLNRSLIAKWLEINPDWDYEISNDEVVAVIF